MSVTTYKLRPGFSVAAPIEKVGTRIDELRRRNSTPGNPEGDITPEAVVEDAASPQSPLHKCFTWDDTEAARKQRLHEARYLLRSFEVIIERPNREPLTITPGMVSIRKADRTRAYTSSAYAMSDEDIRKQVLGETVAQLRGMQVRLGNLKGISPEVIAAFQELASLLGKEIQAKAARRTKKVAAA